MAKHHPDLVFCRKQPGIAIGRLCEKCDGRCVICDSYVRPHVLVHICDECNYGSFEVNYLILLFSPVLLVFFLLFLARGSFALSNHRICVTCFLTHLHNWILFYFILFFLGSLYYLWCTRYLWCLLLPWMYTPRERCKGTQSSIVMLTIILSLSLSIN